MNKEPASPKSMTCKIWSCDNTKAKKNNWHFQTRRNRGKVSEIQPKIKSLGVGSKVYKLGPYEGTLEELKEFARIKNIPLLKMGAVNIKVA